MERGYAVPVLCGVCLGLILIGVQVSATALDAALGRHRDTALVAFENAGPGVDMLVLGKRISFPFPQDHGESALNAVETAAGETAKKAGVILGRCREGAESICRRCREELSSQAGRGRERYRHLWRRVIDDSQ